MDSQTVCAAKQPTCACAHDRVPSQDRATEYTPESVSYLDISLQTATFSSTSRHWGCVLLMFAFGAMDTSHSPDSFSAPATSLNFPEETPNKVELKHFLESFQNAMDHKPYGAKLRGELPYAALRLAPRSLDDIPPIADTSTRPGATRAALRAQVEYENKLK
eukprot:3229289-Pleurochrysis_carterae.AAC.2